MNMVRKTLLGIVAAAMVLVAAADQGCCASRYQDGFRNIAWGTTRADLPDLGLTEKGLKSIYKSGPSAIIFMEGKGNLDLHLDDVPLLSIFLRFESQVFYGFDLVFKQEYAQRVHDIIAGEMEARARASTEPPAGPTRG